ncbi:MAG: glycosyltransferase, partial [Acidimicrobiales bacterium]|nr:glycosyltransferase [Acidimicrobiales bacterium]
MTNAAVALPPIDAPLEARVALVHDFMVERGGAERVLLELSTAFPGAMVHTAMFDPAGTYSKLSGLRVNTLVPDRFPFLTKEHRRSLPLAVRAFRQAEIEADILIANSSGLSHLAGCTGRRVVYCQTPARWLHRSEEYLRRVPEAGARLFASGLQRWLLKADVEAVRSADAFIVNSRHMANVVESVYGITSEVVRPPSSLRVDGPTRPVPGIDPGFFLTPSRLLSYKRFDVLCETAEALPESRFVVIGDGPMRKSVLRIAPSNVNFLGSVPEETLRWAYDACRAVVLTCADDFGLVPREAAAFGKLAVVPSAGGYLEQSRDGLAT